MQLIASRKHLRSRELESAVAVAPSVTSVEPGGQAGDGAGTLWRDVSCLGELEGRVAAAWDQADVSAGYPERKAVLGPGVFVAEPCSSIAPAHPGNSGASSGAGPREDEVVRLATTSGMTWDDGATFASAAAGDFSVEAEFSGPTVDEMVRLGTPSDMASDGDALFPAAAAGDFSVEAEFAATAASLGVRPVGGSIEPPVAEPPLPALQARSDSPARSRVRADSPARKSGGDGRPVAAVLDGEGDTRGQTAVVLSARFVGKWLADGHEVVMVRRRPLEWSSVAGAERPVW